MDNQGLPLERPIQIPEPYNRITSLVSYMHKFRKNVPDSPTCPIADPESYWDGLEVLGSKVTDAKWLSRHGYQTTEDSLRSAAKSLYSLFALVYHYETDDGDRFVVRYFYPNSKK